MAPISSVNRDASAYGGKPCECLAQTEKTFADKAVNDPYVVALALNSSECLGSQQDWLLDYNRILISTDLTKLTWDTALQNLLDQFDSNLKYFGETYFSELDRGSFAQTWKKMATLVGWEWLAKVALTSKNQNATGVVAGFVANQCIVDPNFYDKNAVLFDRLLKKESNSVQSRVAGLLKNTDGIRGLTLAEMDNIDRLRVYELNVTLLEILDPAFIRTFNQADETGSSDLSGDSDSGSGNDAEISFVDRETLRRRYIGEKIPTQDIECLLPNFVLDLVKQALGVSTIHVSSEAAHESMRRELSIWLLNTKPEEMGSQAVFFEGDMQYFEKVVKERPDLADEYLKAATWIRDDAGVLNSDRAKRKTLQGLATVLLSPSSVSEGATVDKVAIYRLLPTYLKTDASIVSLVLESGDQGISYFDLPPELQVLQDGDGRPIARNIAFAQLFIAENPGCIKDTENNIVDVLLENPKVFAMVFAELPKQLWLVIADRSLNVDVWVELIGQNPLAYTQLPDGSTSDDPDALSRVNDILITEALSNGWRLYSTKGGSEIFMMYEIASQHQLDTLKYDDWAYVISEEWNSVRRDLDEPENGYDLPLNLWVPLEDQIVKKSNRYSEWSVTQAGSDLADKLTGSERSLENDSVPFGLVKGKKDSKQLTQQLAISLEGVWFPTAYRAHAQTITGNAGAAGLGLAYWAGGPNIRAGLHVSYKYGLTQVQNTYDDEYGYDYVSIFDDVPMHIASIGFKTRLNIYELGQTVRFYADLELGVDWVGVSGASAQRSVLDQTHNTADFDTITSHFSLAPGASWLPRKKWHPYTAIVGNKMSVISTTAGAGTTAPNWFDFTANGLSVQAELGLLWDF